MAYKINDTWELEFERGYYVLKKYLIDKKKTLKKAGKEIENDRYGKRYQADEFYPVSWNRIILFLIDEKVKESDIKSLKEVNDKIDSLQIDKVTSKLINDMGREIYELQLKIKALEKTSKKIK